MHRSIFDGLYERSIGREEEPVDEALYEKELNERQTNINRLYMRRRVTWINPRTKVLTFERGVWLNSDESDNETVDDDDGYDSEEV